MKFQSFKNWLNENALTDTFWENDKTKLFLKDILKYLDEQKIKTTYIDTNKIKKLLIDAERDEERVQKSNLRYPLIVTQSKDKFIDVLDGQHRLEKALTNNIDKLKIRILDLDTAPEEYKELFIKDYKPTPDLFFKIDGVEVPIVIIPKEKWPKGKNDPTEFDSARKIVNIRSDYDYKKDPFNWLSHELIHYQRDKKGIKDDGKEYPTNNTEEAAYTYQFKKFKKQGVKNIEDLPNLGKSQHKQILKKYWDNI